MAAAALVLLLLGTAAEAREVAIPLRLDVAFVRRMLVEQLYTEPGERAAIWRDPSGCGRLVLSEPRVDVADGRLRIESRGEARAGLSLARFCLFPIGWKGIVEVLAEPALDPARPVVSLVVVDSSVFDDARRKRLTTGVVWDRVKAHLHPRIAALRIDVSRPLEELRGWLPLVVPGSRERIDRLLASLGLREPRVVPEGIGVTVAFAIEPRPPAPPPAPEPALSPEEMERWQTRWQRWDAFLAFVLKAFARDVDGELRRALLAVLLDARHDLLDALAPAVPGAPDPVPGLFLETWDRLAPVLHRAARGLPAETALRYMSFITAADALAALSRLGPETGIDISADGLRRLARVVDPASLADPVAWSPEVDPELRALFGFDLPLPPPDVAPEVDTGPLSWLVPSAWAAIDPAAVRELNTTAAGEGDLNAYLRRVRGLLLQVNGEIEQAAGLLEARRPLYRNLLLATAWQESCWRQFVRRRGRLAPIESPVGSIGIMQVNQHVWRGLYDLRGLRGDIAYNARAGGEILLHYLEDHAVAHGEERLPGGADNLARATYAVYNGGPSHRARYRTRTRRSLRRIDDAFWEKYQAVQAGREMDVVRCFTPS